MLYQFFNSVGFHPPCGRTQTFGEVIFYFQGQLDCQQNTTSFPVSLSQVSLLEAIYRSLINQPAEAGSRTRNRGKMKIKPHHVSFSCLLFFFFHGSQAQPSTTGYNCTANQTTYPCQTYAFYRATAPDFLDLASVGDLFHVSRLMISEPSNISSPSSPLIPDQFLFVPITCSCNSINTSFGSLSAANLTYTIKGGDTFYLVSTSNFQNLTTFQSVEVFNPTFVPTQLEIGDKIVFPIFCKCPDETRVQNGINYLVSYVFQPSDSLSLVASRFGVQTQAITNVNGNDIQPFDTIFIPVN